MKIEQLKNPNKLGNGWENTERKLPMSSANKNDADEETTIPHYKDIAKFSGQEISKGGWNMRSKLKNCYNSKR